MGTRDLRARARTAMRYYCPAARARSMGPIWLWISATNLVDLLDGGIFFFAIGIRINRLIRSGFWPQSEGAT